MPRVIVCAAPGAVFVREKTPATGVPWRDMINCGTECDYWRAPEPLTMHDVDCGNRYRVHCATHEWPMLNTAVVYQVTLSSDGHSMVSRPVPVYSTGHALQALAPPTPSLFVFDDQCDAAQMQLFGAHTPRVDLSVPKLDERLFLARYMPMSSTSLVAARAEVTKRVVELLATAPWILFLEGYIDHDGLVQALDDFLLLPSLLSALHTGRMPEPLWWARLFQAYVAIDKRLALGGVLTATVDSEDADTRAALSALTALGVMTQTPVGEFTSRLQTKANDFIKNLLEVYVRVGRLPAQQQPSGSSITDALKESDLLVVDLLARFTPAVCAELSSIMTHALLVLTRGDALDQAQLRVRYEEATQLGRSRHPVVVLVDAHTWSSTDVVRTLIPLMSARQLIEGNKYALTGSGVPFKLLMITNGLEMCTPWMRTALRQGFLPPRVFFPRIHSVVAHSSCVVYTELREAVMRLELDLDAVFVRTCRRLLENNPPTPGAPIHLLHPASPIFLCRALPPNDQGLSDEEARSVQEMREGIHLRYGDALHVALRTRATPPTCIFLYPNPETGALPLPGVVCTALCESKRVHLVAEPQSRFPTLESLFD